LRLGGRITLIETIAVLALLAILGTVAVRALRPSGASLVAETALLKTHLRYVQALAMAGGSEQSWGLGIAADRYWLVLDGAMPANVSLPGRQGAERPLPADIRVSAGAGLVAFDAWGSPGAADIAVTVTDGSANRVVVITAVTGFVR
jgi:type II secretory pathway pseudopilin PulG